MERLVFLDETGLNTKMTRLYGRAPRNKRCRGFGRQGHWKTFTFIGALRNNELTAPLLFDGPMDGATFLTYVQHCLSPLLKKGDLVICDNLSSHKVSGVRQAIEKREATLIYLPAYSPDLNPIEMVFSKLKAHLRKSSSPTFEQLQDALAGALNTLTPSECSNFFKHAQYATN